MNDDQIKNTLGVEETRQMLEVREMIKSQLTPEAYDEAMRTYKASLKSLMDKIPGSCPLDVADFIVGELDADTTLDENDRETWKAVIVIAAFEMQEF